MPRSSRSIDPKQHLIPYSWRDPVAELPGVKPEQLDITTDNMEYEKAPHVPPVQFKAKGGPNARGVE